MSCKFHVMLIQRITKHSCRKFADGDQDVGCEKGEESITLCGRLLAIDPEDCVRMRDMIV